MEIEEMEKRRTVPPELLPYWEQAKERYAQQIGFQHQTEYAYAREQYPVEEKTILYTSFRGRGMVCNPYALFRYIRSQPRFADYKHIWALDDLENHRAELAAYQDDKKVEFVVFQSPEHIKALATAKYVINNSTEQGYFVKRPEQVVINTWHGIPLKQMGFDMPGGALDGANTLRGFLYSDYLLSPNRFMTETMYEKAYKLHDLFDGKIIEAGYPRCDSVLNTDRSAFIQKVRAYGVELDPKKKIILYAPTWRGEQFLEPNLDMEQNKQFIALLEHHIDTEQYQVLFKPHQIVYKRLMEQGLLEATYIPATVDANELLSVTDVLISDYSSIFFDFLATRRPILFYVPDAEDYQKIRGMYFAIDQLPGPVTDQPEQVGTWLEQITGQPDSYPTLFDYANYQNAVDKFVPKEDGHVCERIVSAVFDGDETNVIRLKSNKPRILFHVDILKPNGITSAALNLLRHMDYEKYDISVNAIFPKNDTNTLSLIPTSARPFCRAPAMTTTLEEYAEREYCLDMGISATDSNPLFPQQAYERHFQHCFGQSKFDYIINFSGYNGSWSNTLCTEKDVKQIIWMHNDLQAELENRLVDGKQIFRRSLPTTFKNYALADAIVGCSKSIMEVNRNKLSTPETYDKFTYVHNMLDTERIYQSVENAQYLSSGGTQWLVEENAESRENCLNVNLVPVPTSEWINFVSVGRLSVEKNQTNLIRAFARLARENEKVRLYLLGDGSLADDLRKEINAQKMNQRIFLLGNVRNPFAIEQKAQCFILPSLHEEMPMVVLEARTLGLPIIVSEFSTVADSLRENGQLLIQTDEESIYQGMKAFLDGKVPNEFRFHPEEYNQGCLNEFNQLLGRLEVC
jgi:CDP-glycerol glycerophosphotransferase (TagB/SpsB family)/glycosyltransferase involved in cell wall biosynthesis